MDLFRYLFFVIGLVAHGITTMGIITYLSSDEKAGKVYAFGYFVLTTSMWVCTAINYSKYFLG